MLRSLLVFTNMSSNMTRCFCEGIIIPSQTVARSLRPPVLLNLRPRLIQSSLSRQYTISSNKLERWNSVSRGLKNKLTLAQTFLYSINWNQHMQKMQKMGKLCSNAAFQTSNWIYHKWEIKLNNRRVDKTMERGTQLQEEVSCDMFLPRFDIMEELEKMFQLNEHHPSYHIIRGGHGTGKTTLIKSLANDIGKGIVYIDVPEDLSEFNDKFAKAINYVFEDNNENFCKIDNYSYFIVFISI